MPEEHKLSISAAILINTNITMGSGLFINTVLLSQVAGALGGLTYAIVGIALLPLILAISQLLKRHPLGGFYTYGQHGLNDYAGFISTWCYFVGKLASATLSIHVAFSLLQTIIPSLARVSIFALDSIVIILYTLLNMLNVKEGSKIQSGFIVLKMIPIFFVLLSGLFLFQGSHLSETHLIWQGLPSSIPLGLFAFYGFESACAISKSLKNPKRAYLSILASYFISVLLTTLFQTLFYASIGAELARQTNYLGAFPALIGHLGLSELWQAKLVGLLHIAIASSALGAAYGIIYSNSWNLHTIAQKGHTFFARSLARFNKNRIPYICVLTEAVVCFIYLFSTWGSQIPLQLIAVLSLTITYTISVVALLVTAIKEKANRIIAILALIVCLGLLTMCIRNFFVLFSLQALIGFLLILIVGSIMFAFTPGTPVVATITGQTKDDDDWEKYY